MINKFLLENGWKVLRQEDDMIFAKRISTGKKALFGSKEIFDEFGDIEISRVWTKKDFHPFIYSEKEGKLIFYDFIFNEFVNNP